MATVFARLANNETLSSSLFIIGSIGLLLAWFSHRFYLRPRKALQGIPIIHLDGLSPTTSWNDHAEEVMAKGRKDTNDGFFQVMTGNGPKIIAPNRFLDELKADNTVFNVHMAFSQEFFWQYSGMLGFRGMRENPEVIRHVVRGKVTAAMFAITDELAVEVSQALEEQMSNHKLDDGQWHSIAMQPICEDLIARQSTLLFLGREACKDRTWLQMMTSYTFNAFRAATKLRKSRPLLRWFGHAFVFDESKVVRAQCANMTERLQPLIKDRMKLIEAGEYKSLKVGDTLGWLLEAGKRYQKPVNVVDSQLLLALASVHNTSEALHMALMDACRHPEVIKPLRDEANEVLAEHGGWNKSAVANLNLMDSFLKESQRLSPNSIYPFRRVATRDVVLSDGTLIPKGYVVTVSGRNKDSSVFSDPQKFDFRRFLVSPGDRNDKLKFASSSPDMVQFGYGEHACAGKQVAATEIKLALAQFLLAYDFEMVPSEQYVRFWGGQRTTSKTAKFQVRRRSVQN